MFCSFVCFFFFFLLPALVGLSLVYVMDTANLAQFSVRQLSEVENLMTSVERVMTYAKLDTEPGYDNETRPPEGWPDNADIRFINVSLRYHKDGPKVLKNINLSIDGKAKIGIAGRTGAGKSSIVASLLRMPDAEGDITIDGVNIKSLNLQECRRYISVLGQNPVLFSGTLRMNLDPLEKHNDDKLWDVLNEVKLKSLVQNLKGCLDFEISERAANLSVGEQQLVCLARVLAEGNKIIILDEPTAHVDPKMERAIQEIIHNKLQDCTIITIAHHLNTIKDCDKIFVFQDGEVAESGAYEELLKIDGGVFATMAEL